MEKTDVLTDAEFWRHVFQEAGEMSMHDFHLHAGYVLKALGHDPSDYQTQIGVLDGFFYDRQDESDFFDVDGESLVSRWEGLSDGEWKKRVAQANESILASL